MVLSRTLSLAERNYDALKRELLAVVSDLQTVRAYLLYDTFTGYTEHNDVQWYMNITEPSGSITRWRIRLAAYDLRIKKKKHSDNVHADALCQPSLVPQRDRTTPDAIPAFAMETETKKVSDGNKFDSSLEDLLEEDYDQVDRLLATELDKICALHFSLITLEELVWDQLRYPPCSEIHQKIDAPQ